MEDERTLNTKSLGKLVGSRQQVLYSVVTPRSKAFGILIAWAMMDTTQKKITRTTTNIGFTLIELVVVVAIVGILAVISVLSYQSYIVNVQINRVVGELSVYKTPFEERLGSSGRVTNSDIGYTPSNLTSGSQAVNIGVRNADGSGHLQVTMGGKAHPSLSGVILRLERSPLGTWECVIDPRTAAGWKPSYLPVGCRL